MKLASVGLHWIAELPQRGVRSTTPVNHKSQQRGGRPTEERPQFQRVVVLNKHQWVVLEPGAQADVNLVTALVPSDTACLASSPGRMRRTAVWISRLVTVGFLE